MTSLRVSDNEMFITLIRAAESDKEFAAKVLAITQLPEVERKIKMKKLIRECRRKKAPEDFIEALACLGDDAIARKVCEHLEP